MSNLIQPTKHTVDKYFRIQVLTKYVLSLEMENRIIITYPLTHSKMSTKWNVSRKYHDISESHFLILKLVEVQSIWTYLDTYTYSECQLITSSAHVLTYLYVQLLTNNYINKPFYEVKRGTLSCNIVPQKCS